MDWITATGQLILSALLGSTIGWEREKLHKAAGYRTMSLIALGVTLFTLLSLYGFSGEVVVDPSRIAAQIVTGTGFLGAGVIIFKHDKVHNLTTAATIWVVAAIGMSVGVGWYGLAVVATIITLVILLIVRKLTPRFEVEANSSEHE